MHLVCVLHVLVSTNRHPYIDLDFYNDHLMNKIFHFYPNTCRFTCWPLWKSKASVLCSIAVILLLWIWMLCKMVAVIRKAHLKQVNDVSPTISHRRNDRHRKQSILWNDVTALRCILRMFDLITLCIFLQMHLRNMKVHEHHHFFPALWAECIYFRSCEWRFRSVTLQFAREVLLPEMFWLGGKKQERHL